MPVLIALLGTIPVAASSPALTWLLLVPVLSAVWVVRAGVVADHDGLEVGNGLGRRRYRWAEVEGFDVPRHGPVRLLLVGGQRVPLLALPRRHLPSLLTVASPGSGPA